MKVIKYLLLIIAISMALSFTVTMKTIVDVVDEEGKPFDHPVETPTTMYSLPSKRVMSRFLVEKTATPARKYANLCRTKHQKYCVSVNQAGHVKNSTCCDMRCVHLETDRLNCGVCDNMCSYNQVCCSKMCVDITDDPAHCGKCHSKCSKGGCENSMCKYAA